MTQSPLLQIIFEPHSVPWATFPLSVQIAFPVEHEILASRQGLPGTAHVTPSEHATHSPEEQTMPLPHGVPSDWTAPVSSHFGPASLVQATLPM
jgi:hypothetical protein